MQYYHKRPVFAMKTSTISLAFLVTSVSSFSPAPTFVRQSTAIFSSGMDLSGNSWKPDSQKMGATDTGDFFPEGYNPDEEVAFSSGMMGSQEMLSGNKRSGPQLPGMENLGADAVVRGGIATADGIPAGMEFVPSAMPDGEYTFQVASSGAGAAFEIMVPPICMTFEDYYAAFATGSHPSLSVRPATGRMDRKGGEPTMLEVVCEPNGQGGTFYGALVINLPEDGSKICYKIIAKSF